MRLQTEAFDHLPVSGWSILLTMLAILIVLAVLYCVGDDLPRWNRLLLFFLLGANLAILCFNGLTNLAGGVDPDQLNADLKDQLGIEKVSYDDDYRELTGEKDGTVVFCVLAEEGERGNIYEVICK